MDILFFMDNINKKKRIVYLDIAKGIGMILVLLGHLQNDTVFSYSPYILSLCSWIFSFHMALFFIISGMLMAVKGENAANIKVFTKKRFKSIMVPYFWFSLIYVFIVLYSLLIDKVVPLKTLFIQLWYVFGMYGMNVLWFLPALFAGEILFVFLTQRFKNHKSIIAILLLLTCAIAANQLRGGLPNNAEIYERINELIITLIRPVFACSYIFIGYYIYIGLRLTGTKLSNSRLLIIPAISVLLVINIYINTINRPVDFRSLVLNNYPLYYLSSISGSLAVILISMLLSGIHIGSRINEETSFPVLKFYGVNSLTFMAVHNNSAIMRLSLLAAMYLNQYLTRARGYICYGIIVLIFLLYVTVTIFIINRFFPFITGRPVSRRNS